MQIPLRIRCGIAADSLTESTKGQNPCSGLFSAFRNLLSLQKQFMTEYSGPINDSVLLHDIVSGDWNHLTIQEKTDKYLKEFGFEEKSWPNDKSGEYYGYYEDGNWVTGQYSRRGRIEGWENENSNVYAKISLAEWQNDDSFRVEITDKNTGKRSTWNRIKLKEVKEIMEVLRPHFRGEAVAIMTGIM